MYISQWEENITNSSLWGSKQRNQSKNKHIETPSFLIKKKPAPGWFFLLSFFHWNVFPGGVSGIDLSWSSDGFFGFSEFFPLSNPAGKPSQGKHDREHVGWNSQSPV